MALRCSLKWLSVVVWLLAGDALGQFASTISVPPDPAPSAIGSNTRLNLEAGGELPAVFQAGLPDGTGTNVEVNINGGLVGGGFRANGGSVVNIMGGTFVNGFDSGLRANSGSVVNIAGGNLTGIAANSGSSTRISGGVYAGTIFANSGSAIRILGDQFRLDGVPIAGLEDVGDSHIQSVLTNQVLTGILSDGTPFFISNLKADSISSNTLTIERTSVSPAGPALIHVPFDSAPVGIQADQTLVVAAGGNVDSSFRAGWSSSLRVEGGNLGAGLQTVGTHVGMTAGSIGSSARFFTATDVEISGGALGDAANVHEGATLRVSGGRVGLALQVSQGGTLEISGGAGFEGLSAPSAGSMKLIGGDFRINGQPLTNPELQTIGGTISFVIPNGSSLTGVLADGTPFSMSGWGSTFSQTLQAASLPPIGPATINAANDFVPLGIREGQTLMVGEGAVVGDYFNAGRGSKVIITGGEIGKGLDAVDAEIVVSGGSIGALVSLGRGTVFAMSGGTIDAPPSNLAGAQVFNVSGGSQATVSGGLIDGRVYVDGVLNLAGGEISGRVRAVNGSEFHIFGTQFTLDGVDITASLPQNLPLTILDRGVSLTGTLADGTPFDFVLNPNSSSSAQDVVDPLATLTVSLVLPGDYNADGVVDAADYTTWRNVLGQQMVHGSGADGDFDGYVTQADIAVWKDHFGILAGGGGSAATTLSRVPEPSVLVMASILLMGVLLARGSAFAPPRSRWSTRCSRR